MSQRYEIREAIGQGGLGAVHKAFDTQLQREVAVKRVLTTGQGTAEEVELAGDKLIAEAQTLSSLNHPNIITVFDVGRDENGGFVVMELLDGETLDETVERGVLTAEDFKEVVYQTLEGLIAAQAADVIHRDIKPTNIMLIWQASGRFQLKILDFGLAKFSKNPSVQTMDQEDAVMGSIFFMAPEQFERAELDARTDLYQMGCVYYNSLTGQYPFNGETAPQVMNAHLQHKVVPLEQLRPDLPPVLSQWVMWLINRDIESRPGSAKEALNYFPKDLSAAPALPVQAVIPTAEPATSSVPSVKIATPTGNAQAPAALVTGSPAVATPAIPTATATPAVAAAVPVDPSVSTQAPVAKVPNKKGLSPVLLTALIGAALIAIVGTFVFLHNSKVKKRSERLTALHDQEAPSGNAKDAKMLAGFLSSDSASRADRGAAYRSLLKLKGEGVDEEILNQLKEAPTSTVRKQLSSVTSQRGYKPAMPTILRYARSARDSKDKVVYLRAAQPLASVDNFTTVLDGVKKATDPSERNIYEDTLVSIIRSAPRPETHIKELRTRLDSAVDDEKISLYRILGLLGDEATLKDIAKIADGRDVDEKKAAISALIAWPNRSPLDQVAKMISSGEKSLVVPAARAYNTLSTKPGAVGIDGIIEDWERGFRLFEAYPSERVRMIQRTINEYPHPRTIAMIQNWAKGPWKDDARNKNLVTKVAEQMKLRIADLPTMAPNEPLKGTMARVQGQNVGSNAFAESLTAWTSPDTYFSWAFKLKQGGDYSVSVNQSDINKSGSEFIIYINGTTLRGKSSKTSSYEEFKVVPLKGQVKLAADTVYKLTLVAGKKTQPRMMDLQAVILKK